MAAKKKKKENSLKMNIFGIVIFAILLIGFLKLPLVGEYINHTIRFLFGELYTVAYILLMLIAFYIILVGKFPNPFNRVFMGIVVLYIAFLMGQSVFYHTDSGLEIINLFLDCAKSIFYEEYHVFGGFIGECLYSFFSEYISRIGVIIVIAALCAIAFLLLDVRKLFEKIKKFYLSITEDKSKSKSKKTNNRKFSIFEDEEPFKEKKKTVVKENYLEEPKTKKKETSQDKKSIFIKADGTVKKTDDTIEVKNKRAPLAKEEKKEKTQQLSISDLKENKNEASKVPLINENYKLPSINNLEKVTNKKGSQANINAANDKGARLIEILEDFGINATLVGRTIGPSITKFEIKPESNVKVSKITQIQDNLKMELAAKSIRIEAPIPGKSVVGVEIPNVEMTTVKMIEVMSAFPQNQQDNKLLFGLGKGLDGRTVFCQLDKMPHLLIAGATGSGKSVCVNSIITTIMMRCKPNEVKLLLIDPKKVEFTSYRDIPHLIGPVITDAHEADLGLQTICSIMDERYTEFAKCGVRNIEGYNTYVEGHPDENKQPMYRIVVIIDELADLMQTNKKDVEASIQRITQLARACGIHLIVATQRPSTDVITGIIKANIPSRIAFAVTSGVDSRTIIDTYGAEKLLGRGDMLYWPMGDANPTRIQGVYVTDAEIDKIASICAKNQKPFYDDHFVMLKDLDVDNNGYNPKSSDDPLYTEVLQFVALQQKASVSLLQRKFGIGYNRAARLIDILEQEGMIGPANGSKPREVYVQPEKD